MHVDFLQGVLDQKTIDHCMNVPSLPLLHFCSTSYALAPQDLQEFQTAVDDLATACGEAILL